VYQSDLKARIGGRAFPFSGQPNVIILTVARQSLRFSVRRFRISGVRRASTSAGPEVLLLLRVFRYRAQRSLMCPETDCFPNSLNMIEGA
jgi:hypothetical protein